MKKYVTTTFVMAEPMNGSVAIAKNIKIISSISAENVEGMHVICPAKFDFWLDNETFNKQYLQVSNVDLFADE